MFAEWSLLIGGQGGRRVGKEGWSLGNYANLITPTEMCDQNIRVFFVCLLERSKKLRLTKQGCGLNHFKIFVLIKLISHFKFI